MTKTPSPNTVDTSVPNTPSTMQELITKSIETIQLRQPAVLNITGKLVTLPPEGEAIILGDLHGDLASLEEILRNSNFIQRAQKNPKTMLICLGDYIDRGPNQIQVLASLLRLLNTSPSQVILLRGNHEGPEDIPIEPHDYPERLARQYGRHGPSLYHETQNLFNQLYSATIIPGKALLLHGGIPTEARTIQDIAHAHQTHPWKSHLVETLWNDPTAQPDDTYSPRGIGKQFGTNTTTHFLKQVGADVLIRGHESCREGYSLDRNIVTLFSCKLPAYRNTHAAYLDLPLRAAMNDMKALVEHIYKV